MFSGLLLAFLLVSGVLGSTSAALSTDEQVPVEEEDVEISEDVETDDLHFLFGDDDWDVLIPDKVSFRQSFYFCFLKSNDLREFSPVIFKRYIFFCCLKTDSDLI